MLWNPDGTITVDPPKKPKKITGTRLGAVLGVNRWSTPFEAWCAMTRTWEEPFFETKYTKAGKVIEPKQAEFVASKFPFAKVVSPTDVYGEDYFKKTWGEFFPTNPVFGGMWDYLLNDSKDITFGVIECKTTKRAEDWLGDIPEYYALQAALYAHLKNVDQAVMVCSILEDADYDHPEDFVCTDDNTFLRSFSVSERYPDFEDTLYGLIFWYNAYVRTGNSPQYDEKRDAKILKDLRDHSLSPTTDIEKVVEEAETLMGILAAEKASFKGHEDRLKELTAILKEHGIANLRDGDKTVTIHGKTVDFVLTRSTKTEVDTDALKQDGMYAKYTKTSESYRFTTKARDANAG